MATHSREGSVLDSPVINFSKNPASTTNQVKVICRVPKHLQNGSSYTFYHNGIMVYHSTAGNSWTLSSNDVRKSGIYSCDYIDRSRSAERSASKELILQGEKLL